MVLGWVASYMESQVSGAGTAVEKIPKPSKKLVLDWVVAAWRELQERPELIKRSFKVCGISNNFDGTEDKLVRCTKYISEELQDQPGDLAW